MSLPGELPCVCSFPFTHRSINQINHPCTTRKRQGWAESCRNLVWRPVVCSRGCIHRCPSHFRSQFPLLVGVWRDFKSSPWDSRSGFLPYICLCYLAPGNYCSRTSFSSSASSGPLPAPQPPPIPAQDRLPEQGPWPIPCGHLWEEFRETSGQFGATLCAVLADVWVEMGR